MANEQTRRAVLSGMAAGIGVIGMVEQASAQAQANAKTFVLVHGAWHGGWCWRRVADLLQKQGHKVFTPTMTGLGERSHLIEEPLISLEREFAASFIRIHRNCLVARAAIRGFERAGGTEEEPHWMVVLDGLAERLPVSRRQWPALRHVVP